MPQDLGLAARHRRREVVRYRPRLTDHGAYVFVVEGAARINGEALDRRDSIGVWGVDSVKIETVADASDLLIVETAMIDDAKIKQWEKVNGEVRH